MKSKTLFISIFLLFFSIIIYAENSDIPETISIKEAESLIINEYPIDNPIYINDRVLNNIPIHLSNSDAYFRVNSIQGSSLRKKDFCDQLVELGLLTSPQHIIQNVEAKNSIRKQTFGLTLQNNSTEQPSTIEVEAYVYELTEIGKSRYSETNSKQEFGFIVGNMVFDQIIEKGFTQESFLFGYYCPVIISQIVTWNLWDDLDIEDINSIISYEDQLRIDFLYRDGDWQL